MPYNDWSPDVSASQANSQNTSLDGLNVAEGCPAGNMNAGTRMLMANMRAMWNALLLAGPSGALAFLMPKAGGTFTGDILRDGRGGYLHYTSSSLLSGKVFVETFGAPLPVSPAEGDVFIEV